jgi:hypothetical protein
MMRNLSWATLALAGAALLMLAALDWVGYTRFLLSLAGR